MPRLSAAGRERAFVTTVEKIDWRRSTFCATGACVEVAEAGNEFLVRDSKNPESPILRFTADEWSAFVAGVRAGEFGAG